MTRRTKKPVGWRGDPHEHNMARLGIETRDRDFVFRADGVGTSPVNAGNLVDYIVAYETGEIDAQDAFELFSYLVKTGQVWRMQGSYGRNAARLIDAGILDAEGNILVSAEAIRASGLPDDAISHFKEMRENEIEDAAHYKQMAKDYPEYEWVFTKMSGDEKRHAALVKRMERGEDIDIRKVIKDDVGDVLGALEKAGRIAPMNKKKIQGVADRAIDNMDVQKLKASGLEMALVYGLMGAMGKGLGARLMDGQAAPAKK